LIIGSFLNVVILRLDTGLGFGGRSQCFSCSKTLNWYELIPLFSFLFQKGKCRGCMKKISLQYPIVELITGVLFLLTYLKVGLTPTLLPVLVIIATLIVISVFDTYHKQIPTIPLLVFYLAVVVTLVLVKASFTGAVISGSLAALPFLAIWVVSKGRWLGFGDVLLMIGFGAWLGISSGLTVIILAAWIGALFGIVGMVFGVAKMKTAIPFGPFLVLGALLSFLYTINIESIAHLFSWIV
jgi:leader peptidase (prepilin peptidase)/N-methyltransferase